ncbi:MAG: symmetrical bis(5'-nucleosyl)-tetraphosphatase [Gammaproteobacteria bacterium]|nr:symmetrical bis(5'-nucleosyl)-tetraphosphatase [Gammaproteobacteria bacterium]
MATYAIGDIQGCFAQLNDLLEKVAFSSEDKLWLLGDLINRGPDSLDTLLKIHDMQDQCTIVLGNHDLHFLAIYFGGHNPSSADTFDELLASAHAHELAHWLRGQKLFHYDDSLGYAMSHAGIPHIWTLAEVAAYAKEVEAVISGADSKMSYTTFFQQMYGNEPPCWVDDLVGMARVRSITNYLTRMRLIRPDGTLEFSYKGALDQIPAGWKPWFELSKEQFVGLKLIFGHWAAIDGVTGVADIIALDTGVVWGRYLTAMTLETGVKTTTSVT